MSKLILADNTSKVFAELAARHQVEVDRLSSAINRLASLSLGEVSESLKKSARNTIESEINNALANLTDIGLTLVDESRWDSPIPITDQGLRWRINNPDGKKLEYLTALNSNGEDTIARYWTDISPKHNCGADQIKRRYKDNASPL